MEMPDVYRALWRHKWFVVLLTGALVGAAYFLTKQEQRHYQASTLIRIQQRIQDPGQSLGALETGQILAQTYARIVETTTVAQRIYDQLGGQIPLSEIAVTAKPVQDLELVTITAEATTPKRAQTIANAAPPALRAFIRDTGTLHDQVVTVEKAQLPLSPSSPKLKLNLILAFLLGLILNGGIALLMEVLSDRLPGSDELEGMTGYPVVASIPTLKFTRRARFVLAQAQVRELEPAAIASKARSG
jgi:capsular polysaccharide biosynthesis protein